MPNVQCPMRNAVRPASKPRRPDQIMYFTRRKFLARAAVAAVATGCISSRATPRASKRSGMGIVTYAFLLHQKATKGAGTGLDYNEPLGYLEACHLHSEI